ncbi:transposase [Xenorhabdus vietnamensis]|uniref:Transposase n=1 Tax=Xenorhabdus vietnamensis TaxID=351656 RepID=A0A1Y2SAU9_9GAMM|nr:DUF4158 domain-containing protein [Xenorhabdus vietnamensis]OTA15742.1 transposase [Xenorhabdus vietnamensis]
MRSQQQAILSLFGYRNWSPQYTAEIESHLGYLLRYYPKGHNAFRQLLAYFGHQKLIIPSYRTLQDMFSSAFITEENRLDVAVSSLPTAITDQLIALVQRDDGITALNIIRAESEGFSIHRRQNAYRRCASSSISLYTLLANYVVVNAKNIGLNEYEGHSLYDMIYNNNTDIDIHIKLWK